MRTVIVGLGVQGQKRLALAGQEVVATVDPVVADGHYRTIEQVPRDSFDGAMVCTPDQTKLPILEYLLSHGKHVLVEKPLLSEDPERIRLLGAMAQSSGVACYTAYNHRFEPHIMSLKGVLDEQVLGEIYLARFFYGNGTVLNVRSSPWRDQGAGVLSDLGSHLLDMTLFLFGQEGGKFERWSFNRFENMALDHCLFGSSSRPVLEFEVTLLSWKNTFTIDVFGQDGSAHINGLCKWGPTTLTVRKRVFPSGKPEEEVQTVEGADPTWVGEYDHFKELCRSGGTNIQNDIWINAVLNDMTRTASVGIPS